MILVNSIAPHLGGWPVCGLVVLIRTAFNIRENNHYEARHCCRKNDEFDSCLDLKPVWLLPLLRFTCAGLLTGRGLWGPPAIEGGLKFNGPFSPLSAQPIMARVWPSLASALPHGRADTRTRGGCVRFGGAREAGVASCLIITHVFKPLRAPTGVRPGD